MMQIRWLLVCLILLCAGSIIAANPPGPSVTSRESERAITVEDRKLDLEREKLNLEKDKNAKELEQKRNELDQKVWDRWIAFLAVIVPVCLAIAGFWSETSKRRLEETAQRESREETEKLQFQLKAAEIALDVRNSREIQPKAIALAQLFPSRLPKDFAKNLDPETIRFGPPATDAKLELLKLLSQYPTQRMAILRAWGQMFPGDTGTWKASEHPNYSWFDALQNDSGVNGNLEQ